MKKFESIKTGEKAQLTHTIRQSDIDQYVELTGDDNKIHVDQQYTSKTAFKKPVVHGMLSASFISTLIGTKLPGDGALWYQQSIKFLMPVRVGDKITVFAKVINKIKRTKTIQLSTEIYNQNNQKVITGTASVKLIEEVQPSAIQKAVKVKNNIALVIGGTGGIGKATCFQLARDGFDVAIHYYKNIESANRLKKNIEKLGNNATVVNADIKEIDQVDRMIQRVLRKLGSISVLVNCATTPIPNIKIADLEWRNMQEQYDVNIKGAFNIIKFVVPIMEENGYGKIINLITQYIEDPKPELAHYITAKSALSGFTKALATELAPKGIQVNLISPGMTDTQLLADIPEKVRLLTAAQAPLRRLASPDDIARVISFLSSEKSDYLTGETIRVNGGQVMI
ncbi:hypothetical protein CMO90_01350 [Candidatus Woesearchaeota archaeon]|jgi:3-oxoacyl-[acyl-carrier protein] reductase|nr:hypothetical protein [Candidatus Woesearchaeota archaeon]|tara:strand:- start:1145 stop:2332 length:1188 start_codon:yes stop_codon:yes gene_type:complete